jgi:hypothetical protein
MRGLTDGDAVLYRPGTIEMRWFKEGRPPSLARDAGPAINCAFDHDKLAHTPLPPSTSSTVPFGFKMEGIHSAPILT